MQASHVRVSVLSSMEEIRAEIRDPRPDSLAIFHDLDEMQREQLGVDAWTIGLRAVYNAHASAQESKLKDVGQALIDDVDHHLKAHIQLQQNTITTVLERYFDTKDGQVTQRLEAFVADQGVLARLLDRYLGPNSSVMAESLAKQVGESSPLFKKLSPTESEGLVKVLEKQLRSVMADGHSEMVRALDPLVEDGAVARFLRSLREELKGAEADRARQLSVAVAALDANDENSLLSRLIRETQAARRDVVVAMNPDAAGSPLAILKSSLTTMLQASASSQMEFAQRQEERQIAFEKAVHEALARIETKRQADLTSPRGGRDFEDSVIEFVRFATQGAPCILDVTGTTSGVGRCKKGDAVLRFTEESAFANSGVVFEAKHEANFTVQKALNELDEARKNRDASAGVFVMARSHATDGFPRFARYANNVIVTWDEQDPQTDIYLHAAIMLGTALVTRHQSGGDTGDIEALRKLESRIDTELSRLDKMEKHSETIRKNVDGISEEIRKGKKALDRLVRDAQSTLRALNVELHDEEAERGSPIQLTAGSLERAQLAISGDSDESAQLG